MSAEIIVALIGLIGTIVTVLVTSKNTRDTVTQQLSTSQAVTKNEIEHIKQDMAEMKADIKEHNHYAKLFSETVPVIQEQMKVANHRLADLESLNR